MLFLPGQIPQRRSYRGRGLHPDRVRFLAQEVRAEYKDIIVGPTSWIVGRAGFVGPRSKRWWRTVWLIRKWTTVGSRGVNEIAVSGVLLEGEARGRDAHY
jgi:hypothetical protein